MHDPQEKVREFHLVVVEQPVSPAAPEIRHGYLRAKLILEEAIETAFALVGARNGQVLVHTQLNEVLQQMARDKRTGAPDLVEAIDGCMDLLYVTYGTMEDIGLDSSPFFDEVHRSNMSKAGGTVDVDGKKLKPRGYSPPDIAGVLARVSKVVIDVAE